MKAIELELTINYSYQFHPDTIFYKNMWVATKCIATGTVQRMMVLELKNNMPYRGIFVDLGINQCIEGDFWMLSDAIRQDKIDALCEYMPLDDYDYALFLSIEQASLDSKAKADDLKLLPAVAPPPTTSTNPSTATNTLQGTGAALLELVLCTCCAEFITDLVRTCPEHHPICSKCLLQQVTCPKCRIDITDSRNVMMATAINRVSFAHAHTRYKLFNFFFQFILFLKFIEMKLGLKIVFVFFFLFWKTSIGII